MMERVEAREMTGETRQGIMIFLRSSGSRCGDFQEWENTEAKSSRDWKPRRAHIPTVGKLPGQHRGAAEAASLAGIHALAGGRPEYNSTQPGIRGLTRNWRPS
jgi:hypothetical protein